MMEFDLPDELTLLVETTRQFAADHLGPALREAEAARSIAPSVRAAYAEIGLEGLELPESLGGAALGSLARCLVNEELAAEDVGAAIALDRLGPALHVVRAFGGEAALADLLEVCSAEPEGRAVVVHVEDDARTRGPVSFEAPWVPAGKVSAVVLLGPASASLVTGAIETEAIRGAGLRAAGAARLVLDAAPARAAWRDGEAAAHARSEVRLWVASLLLGVLRAACAFSRAYAVERKAFGRPIAHHQALAFLITDMNMALESARLMVHEAASRLDAGRPARTEAAMAYVECVDAARLIGPNGVQILGGHGFMADYPVEKHMREARALGLLGGGLDAAVEEAGRMLVATDRPLAIDRLAEEAN
jgi:alkylation response protein AidB-like acyl-CoA dehydrogenase